MKRAIVLGCALSALGIAVLMAGLRAEQAAGPTYHSLFSVVVSPDSKTVYASDHTAGRVAVVDAATNKKTGEVTGLNQPTGLALSADGSKLYVAEYGAADVAVVDTKGLTVGEKVKVGVRPIGLTLAPKSNRLIVCNRDTHDLSIIDLGAMKEVGRAPAMREPMYAAITPDETKIVVSNALPVGPATDPTLAACVCILDAKELKKVGCVKLPAGCTNLRGVAVSPDGKWAYTVHGLGRFNVPPTQLERGWMNTNAISIIDLTKNERYATMLLDYPTEGAADPWGLTIAPDGKRLFISLSGTHQVVVIQVAKLHELLEGKVPDELAGPPDLASQNTWFTIKKTPIEGRQLLTDDLAALYQAGVIERYACGGVGPRGIAIAPDGVKLYVANYYSGTLTAVDTTNGKLAAPAGEAEQPAEDPVRRGERVFHDAILCFQHWQSCASCHPEARADGLRWDLLNDGMGNPKRTRTMVFADRTPPMMSLGVRKDMETAVRAGFKFILFCVPSEEDVQAVMAYLSSLKCEPAPTLGPNGELSESAKRGQTIFNDAKTGCAGCHKMPYGSDLLMHDVGTGPDPTTGKTEFKTTTLVEQWRMSPYLHDGRATTLKEVLTTLNKDNKHGGTSQLTPEQIEDLVNYLLTL